MNLITSENKLNKHSKQYMKSILSIAFAFAMSLNMDAQGNESNSLIFTEVCVANIDQTIDYSNNYGGWVELYNPTGSDIALDGWYISDEAENLTKHQLSGYDILKSECYQCVFFDHNSADGEYGAGAAKQVRFKLNRKGGSLYLSKSGKKVDVSLTYPESVPRCSYARTSLNGDEWKYCGMPTPGTVNSGHYAEKCLPLPDVDQNSCLFTSTFDVHVQIPSGTSLRYTTDGSTPTLSNGVTSNNGIFHVSKTTVFRFRLFSDDNLPSGVVTRTYLYKDRDYYLPIVLVTTDSKNLYDNMIGCYTDGNNGIEGRGATGRSNLNMDWVRPVNFEYLTADGEMVINQETSFEVSGGYSRHFKPASFKVQAKKLYDGKGSFDYPVFVNKPYCEYKQLLIRNGGNNNRTDGGPRIKDAITQQTLTSSGFYVDAQEYQPAHVFINGKYLAMMNVREPSNRYHGVANYGYDEDKMDGFEYSDHCYHQKAGTREAFERLMILSENAETDEGFERVAELLDIDEFARYMAAVCYSGTGDWILNNNNLKAYRSTDNGKFHFVFFDQDLTWEKTNNVGDIEYINDIIELYHNVKSNKKFRDKFIAAYCILHSSIYNPERCLHIADSICSLVKVALSYDSRYTTNTYNKLKSTMWDEIHREARIKSLIDTYKLSGRINVNISTNCAHANIQIGGIDVPFGKFSGDLFDGMSVSTNAAEGYRFIGWKNQKGQVVSNERTIHFTEDDTYTAVYDNTLAEGVSPICINEVSPANDIYVNDYRKKADWIELYNRGDEAIDITSLFFSDDEATPKKYQIDAASGVNTIIHPNKHMVVWCDDKASVTQLHLPFKLKNSDGGFLSLCSSDNLWTDTIKYDLISSKETIGRYPDGGGTCYNFYHPTIGTNNQATMYDRARYSAPDTIVSLPSTNDIVSVTYYTIDGRRTQPLDGIYIKVEKYKDGQTRTNKTIVKNGNHKRLLLKQNTVKGR